MRQIWSRQVGTILPIAPAHPEPELHPNLNPLPFPFPMDPTDIETSGIEPRGAPRREQLDPLELGVEPASPSGESSSVVGNTKVPEGDRFTVMAWSDSTWILCGAFVHVSAVGSRAG
jgi:hypothetical protein